MKFNLKKTLNTFFNILVASEGEAAIGKKGGNIYEYTPNRNNIWAVVGVFLLVISLIGWIFPVGYNSLIQEIAYKLGSLQKVLLFILQPEFLLAAGILLYFYDGLKEEVKEMNEKK